MTKPRYPMMGCTAGSQASGVASSSPVVGWPENAWNVNFNNGNVNNNNRNNSGFVRPVRAARAREYQGESLFQELMAAWSNARRRKRPSFDQLSFESCWIDRLLELEEQLLAGAWSPSPSTCFIARRPKAREIHAPAFGDRVVHHWLVPQLESIFDRRFIHDSFSNRKGKGTHAAVERLKGFVRQVHSGQGGGWYLQLDVRNFFNSIHRPTLWSALKPVMEHAGLSERAQRAAHALLRQPPLSHGVRHRSSPAERGRVPAYKRLEQAGPGRGLPIGNLSSQFFANVYLDALDQFVKHELRAQRYVRYVDDFVLVHRDRDQLLKWQHQIEVFLRDRLQLELKPERKLQPLTAGIDFLGYIVRPAHVTVRRRVLGHATEAIQAWGQGHIRGSFARATPAGFRELRSIWSSYEGHLRHANAWNARRRVMRRFAWLAPLVTGRLSFDYRLEGHTVKVATC